MLNNVIIIMYCSQGRDELCLRALQSVHMSLHLLRRSDIVKHDSCVFGD